MPLRSTVAFVETDSPSYAPRTLMNAGQADLTLAVAVDFSTRGEALTAKAAGERYVAFPYGGDPLEPARALYRVLSGAVRRSTEEAGFTLNIAGNGISRFAKHGITQRDINLWLYRLLLPVHTHLAIGRIVTGGQTGMDWAGAVCAAALGIPVLVTMPKGFLQRNAQGQDYTNTQEVLLERLLADVMALPLDGIAHA